MAEQTPAQKAIGGFAPELVSLTGDVLFGRVWARENQLSRRDRSLVTVASLVTSSSFELESHLKLARTNGLTEAELIEALTHLAFYAGWPKAMSAIQVAKRVFAQKEEQE